MMTKTSTQRHIREHIKKHAKMQTSKDNAYMPTSKRYGPTEYRKYKANIDIP